MEGLFFGILRYACNCIENLRLHLFWLITLLSQAYLQILFSKSILHLFPVLFHKHLIINIHGCLVNFSAKRIDNVFFLLFRFYFFGSLPYRQPLSVTALSETFYEKKGST